MLINNQIPDHIKKIHFIAICGTGMGALACMLKDLGIDITGSDQNVYPPMSTFLTEKGIPILKGFSKENLSEKPDLVVVGNTVSRDNPEVVAMLEMGLPCCSMPQAIQHFFGNRKLLLVSGTHGKTTTSSLLAWLLKQANQDPSFFIGGIVQNFSSNYRIGQGPFMVVEGDEYDTAFFDKGPKFLHYHPSHVILTSVEFDHADIYRDLDHVKSSFAKLIKSLSNESLLVAYEPNENVRELITHCQCRCETYCNKTSHWQIKSIQILPPWTTFDVFYKEQFYYRFKTPLMGEHNLANILSTIAVTHDLGIKPSDIANGIESFKGIKRRQEIRGIEKGITVMDDFAHHPTAVFETLCAVKSFYRQGRIIAVFEPRTNSSRRRVFQDVYPDAFKPADIICVRQAPLLEKIPEKERFSSKQLVEQIKRNGQDAHFFEKTDQIIDFVSQIAKANDLVIIMSNGGFDNIHERLLNRLK
ncbi:UDP-N-acetylmuramate:L-alanyl-gamma-D-glutamyl-meso-diaminopimelate ligase [Candidatus Magnetomorum sp. HK-1]|nr:UDP-N-acetylmuramate:L-alanyl-gamma-D-glutamyl-meso-diaminopimelate ligase [Candidatus Magnetomorum sp. HK-1]